MSILGDVIGLVSGFSADKKTNKLNKEQLELEKMLANNQIDISKYMMELSKLAASGVGKGSFTDPYGSGAVYDPATGTWKTQLSPQEKAIQDASYQEELNRNTADQDIRRQGLNDYEKMRERSGTEATRALANIKAFQQGFGKLDPTQIASIIRGDREGAINAGYDDAARAAQTLQLRTGSSAAGDALTTLARNRVRDTASLGSPILEGIQFANEQNNTNLGQLYDVYKGFGDEARAFYDAPFAPSGYAAGAYNAGTDAQKMDLSKLDLALGGSGSAAGTVGQAAQDSGAAFAQFMKNRIANPFGALATGIDKSIEDNSAKVAKYMNFGA